jgi:DNA primase
MATSWDDLIQEIKQRVDLLEVVSEYVKLRPTGGRRVGLCPFHNEKTGSFSVNAERGVWYCFGCGEGGDVIKFLQKIDNLSFPEAVERLARRAGLEVPEKGGGAAASERDRLRAVNELACRFFERALSRSDAALRYMKERGIEPEVARAFRLGYAPDSWDALRNALRREKATDEDLLKLGLLRRKPDETSGGYDFFRDRLIFPIGDAEGRIIAFGGRIMGEGQPKYLNSPETPLFHKSRALYGLHRAAPAMKERGAALVMEGYMDVIAARQGGFPNAVAPLGTALTESHVALLRRICQRALLVFDADGAGIRAALRSLALFEKSELDARIVTLPSGEDPDSLLRKSGPAAFAQCLAEAKPILDYRMEAILNENDLRSDEGFRSGMREIIPLLAQVSVPDGWVKRLAEIRSEGHPERVAFHEEDIRRRIARGGAEERSESFQPKRNAGISDEGEPKVSSAVRRLYKAEDTLLWACLQSSDDAAMLLERLPPEKFIRPEARELATLIVSHLGGNSWEPGLWEMPSEAVASMAGRLMTGPDLIHESAPREREFWLHQAADLLLMRGERERIQSLLEGRTPTIEELQRIKELYQRKR